VRPRGRREIDGAAASVQNGAHGDRVIPHARGHPAPPAPSAAARGNRVLSTTVALTGATVHTGTAVLTDHAVLLDGGGPRIAGLVPLAAVPAGVPRTDLGGGVLAPGFIDVQVNGGGGVLFNDAPTPGTIARIGAAHRRFGTTGFLPTLISTDRETMARAAAAVRAALAERLPGVLGIHFEGPHLNPARRVIKEDLHIRPLDTDDVDLLT
jgi:N-acetylglucosamine-6-phosphate deacetylase